MSIETNIERIAVALEKLIDLQAGRNLVLEAQTTQTQEAADVATEAVEKAANKGRTRKKTEPKEAEEAPVVEKTPDPEPEEPNPAPSIADVQKRAALLAAKYGKEIIVELIGKAEGAGGKISGHTPEQLAELWEAFDSLETEVE